ncbi:MAG: PucC family protein [Granulosicoccus sp.]|nr:PucC family protein [Granulosicoccus sp.]
MGPRFLPFADVATKDLPLTRLLRLSLFQVSVGLALVLLVGTLNRVMIVELNVPSWIVAVMLALPLVFAPFRALIGHKSDNHQCELGWRRVPFIWKGTLWQFGGFAIMPFALLVLGQQGESQNFPLWIGHVSAAIAFLLVGAGVHTVQTAGLALATDLTEPESHPKVVGLMYVTLLLGMLVSSLVFGAALQDFSPGRLVRVIQGAAVVTVFLNFIALWQQETLGSKRKATPTQAPSFAQSWARFCEGEGTIRRLTILGMGTLAFGMADVLLEPFGGHVLNMSVSATTKLTALLALGGLMGFALASRVLGKGADPYRMVLIGALLGVPAFLLVLLAAPLDIPWLFQLGNFMIGFSAALFGHGTLTATMNRAPRDQAGLALGAWGAVQATAAGIAIAFSGVIRDLVNTFTVSTEQLWGIANGYITVYCLEIALLIITIIAAYPLINTKQVSHQVVADSAA